MEAIAEAEQLYPQTVERTRPRLVPVPDTDRAPTIDAILGYEVKVDFSDASRRHDQLSELVEEARQALSADPNTDTTRIEQDIEAILLDDAKGLDDFAKVFVNSLMPEYEDKAGTCGLAGMRYHNTYSGDMGLMLFKTRIKRGRNTLAKAFRKSCFAQEDAREMLAKYEQDPDNKDQHPYQLEPETQTVRYKIGDTSAARALFETEDGIERMRAWIYLHPEMEVLSEEDKDKPTYKARHLQIRYQGVVREVQLMTAEAERISIDDGYHGPQKNDVACHARR